MKVTIEVELSVLMEILNQTPNSNHAIELLDGKYIEPILEDIPNVTNVTYNPWNNQVIFRTNIKYYTNSDHSGGYQSLPSKEYSFPKEVDVYRDYVSIDEWKDSCNFVNNLRES